MRLTLDRSVRRTGEGRVLIGGSPLVLLRLTEAGARLIDSIEATAPVGSTATTRALIDRLLDAGVVHPTWPAGDAVDAGAGDAGEGDAGEAGAGGGRTVADVTVVIPAHDVGAGTLRAIVESCDGVAAVVIVDDASPVPIGPVAGAIVVRRVDNGGPAAARTTGLDHVATDLVAFVDSDVEPDAGWIAGLLGHFADDRVALVAPRVASATKTTTTTRLARYEASRSPLDLGPEPARVRAGTRVSYVPSAAVVCRVEALRGIGGIDASLRFGEDVDMVWRLDEVGHRIRYEPQVVVHHRPRTTLGGWLRQRFSYGSSAAPLARRHPGALAPVRVSGWSAASWVAVVGGWPVPGLAVASATTALLARKLRNVPDGPRQALRLAGLGHLYAGRSLASGLTRAWWPLTAVACLFSRRARRAAVLAVVIPALLDRRSSRSDLDPVTYVVLRLLDDVAYGTGIAAGVIRERSLDAIRPDFRSWPKTASGSTRSPVR